MDSPIRIDQLLSTDPQLSPELRTIIRRELTTRFTGDILLSILVQLYKKGTTGYLSHHLSQLVREQRWNEVSSELEQRWPEVYHNTVDRSLFIKLYNLDLAAIYHALQRPQPQPFQRLVEEEALLLAQREGPIIASDRIGSLITLLEKNEERELLKDYYRVKEWRNS